MATRAAGIIIFRNIDKTIQYLLLQTSYGEHHWTPPKGHVDPGESDWDTAIRETNEEAGLFEQDLFVFKNIFRSLQYEVKGKPKEVVYWLAKLKNPQQKIRLSDEHQDFKWLTLSDAQSVAGFDDMKLLLADFDAQVKQLLTNCSTVQAVK